MELAFADFERLIEQSFEVPAEHDDEVYTRLKLVEVSRLPHGHPERQEPFSLMFEGPKDRPLDQSTYVLVHPEIGEQGIFLVPIGERGDVRLYQSIFN